MIISFNGNLMIQYSRIQCSTMQYDIVQCNLIQYSRIHLNIIYYNTIQYNTTECDTTQCNTIQCDTTQYSTIQCDTTQYNTIPFLNSFRPTKQEARGWQTNFIEVMKSCFYVCTGTKSILTRFSFFPKSSCQVISTVISITSLVLILVYILAV